MFNNNNKKDIKTILAAWSTLKYIPESVKNTEKEISRVTSYYCDTNRAALCDAEKYLQNKIADLMLEVIRVFKIISDKGYFSVRAAIKDKINIPARLYDNISTQIVVCASKAYEIISDIDNNFVNYCKCNDGGCNYYYMLSIINKMPVAEALIDRCHKLMEDL